MIIRAATSLPCLSGWQQLDLQALTPRSLVQEAAAVVNTALADNTDLAIIGEVPDDSWSQYFLGRLLAAIAIRVHYESDLAAYWRPTTPKNFVGDPLATTIFVSSDTRYAQPFGTPSAYRSFAERPFAQWGFATTSCPPHRLRGATELVAESKAAYDWCRLIVGRPTRYDRNMETA